MKKYLYDLYKRKDLIIYLVTSGLKAQNRNTLLGYFWWLLDPFLNVFIYYFVVVIVFKRAGGAEFSLYLVVGMIIWRWLGSTVLTASKSIISQASIITQIYLPKGIFPIGASLTQLINFGFGLVIIAMFLAFFKVPLGINMLWLPFIVLMQQFFMMALSFVAAFACVFVRDIDNILNHLMRLWFFGSPVIWMEDMIPERGRWLLEINPMYHFLKGYRNIFMHNTRPDLISLFNIGFLSLIVVVFMVYYYSRYEHKIIKAL